MIKEIIKDEEQKMIKAIEHLKREFSGIRSGKASIALIENLRVECYGSPIALSQIAALHTPDARTITIKPYDLSQIASIERGIMQSNMGFNPSNDGSIIRIPIPAPTEERRRDYAKMAKKIAEESKVAVRNIRRDGITHIKQEEKNKMISEDDSKKGQKKLQELTDLYCKEIDEVTKKKEAEIMEV